MLSYCVCFLHFRFASDMDREGGGGKGQAQPSEFPSNIPPIHNQLNMMRRTAKPQRPLEQRESDRRRIAQSIVNLENIEDVARELGISEHTARKDKAYVLSEWTRNNIGSLHNWTVAQLQHLEKMQRSVWAEWEKSCRNRTKVIRKRKTSPDGTKEETVEEVAVAYGDPALAAQYTAIVMAKHKITGVEALQIQHANGRNRNISNESTRAEIARLFTIAIEEGVIDQSGHVRADFLPTLPDGEEAGIPSDNQSDIAIEVYQNSDGCP